MDYSTSKLLLLLRIGTREYIKNFKDIDENRDETFSLLISPSFSDYVCRSLSSFITVTGHVWRESTNPGNTLQSRKEFNTIMCL